MNDKIIEGGQPEEFEPIQMATLMEAHEAPNSILRVILLSGKQQLEHKQNSVSSQHAINLLNCLAESKQIDLNKLRKLAFYGVSDEIKGLRPLVWRILLNYLPEDTDSWEEILREKKKIYEMWKDELIVKPKLSIKDRFSDEAKAIDQPKKLTLLDHPLSTQKNSTWNKFYSDKQIWEEIEKDVKRTRVEMAFFMMAVDPERSTPEDIARLERQQHTKKCDLNREDV